ncbi:hypothetical protein D3C75_1093920 [compost metagenome]
MAQVGPVDLHLRLHCRRARQAHHAASIGQGLTQMWIERWLVLRLHRSGEAQHFCEYVFAAIGCGVEDAVERWRAGNVEVQ